MRREEERNKAYIEFLNTLASSYEKIPEIVVPKAFDYAFDIADKSMIKKVCDWLEDVDTDKYIDRDGDNTLEMCMLISDLKKFLEN